MVISPARQASRLAISSACSAARATSNGRRSFSSSAIAYGPAAVNLARPTTSNRTSSPATASKPSYASPPPFKSSPTSYKAPVEAAKTSPFTLPSPSPSSLSSSSPATPSKPENLTSSQNTRNLTSGLSDDPLPPAPTATPINNRGETVDWSSSFHGLSHEPFSKEACEALMQEMKPTDVEIKPDGIIYLPEIKYRRILNKAFGPGGWGLAPRGETIVTPKSVTREYGLVVGGRLVSIARGEQQYFDPEGIPTAAEGCKSNAMMRCCKDLGVASELWDPCFIREFLAKHTKEVWVEHVGTKKKKKIYLRKDVSKIPYPFKESGSGGGG